MFSVFINFVLFIIFHIVLFIIICVHARTQWPTAYSFICTLKESFGFYLYRSNLTNWILLQLVVDQMLHFCYLSTFKNFIRHSHAAPFGSRWSCHRHRRRCWRRLNLVETTFANDQLVAAVYLAQGSLSLPLSEEFPLAFLFFFFSLCVCVYRCCGCFVHK